MAWATLMRASGPAQAQQAIVKLEVAFAIDQAGIHGGRGAEVGDLFGEGIEHALKDAESFLSGCHSGGNGGEEAIASLGGHRGLHPSGNDPRRMHALFGEAFDDGEAELAQLDAGAGQLGIGFDDAGDVADGGIGVHAEEQVGRGKIEEAEGVRLDDLGAVDEFAQQFCGGRNAHGHDGVAGF
jgi:hypothetical protein